MATVQIKVGDTSRDLTDTLTLNGAAINLTGASVNLIWQKRGGAEQSKSATITDAVAGDVSYTFTAADVAFPTEIHFAWQIVFGDTTELTVPSDGNHILKIEPSL